MRLWVPTACAVISALASVEAFSIQPGQPREVAWELDTPTPRGFHGCSCENTLETLPGHPLSLRPQALPGICMSFVLFSPEETNREGWRDAQWRRALAAPAEDPGVGLSTHMWLTALLQGTQQSLLIFVGMRYRCGAQAVWAPDTDMVHRQGGHEAQT